MMKPNTYLNPALKDHFSDCPDLFDTLKNLPGKIYSVGKGRETKRVEINGQGYFIKLHSGVGWGEIFKNLAIARAPILGASTEFMALGKLHDLGIHTMTVAGFSEDGLNPATRRSWLITHELLGTESLENLTRDWQTSPPTIGFKRALIQNLGQLLARFHGKGLNHRDCYLCHFRIPLEQVGLSDPKQITLYVMDLHRCQMRSKVPTRWLIKDLGSLYFSARKLGLTTRDFFRFIRAYEGKSLQKVFAEKKSLWQQVEKRCGQLAKKHG